MNNLVVLIGPTAVGKTDTSLAIAAYYGCPIISADSRQMYSGMEIGTAMPTKEEQARQKHYFVGHLSPGDYYSAARYEEEVLALLEKEQPQALVLGLPFHVDGAECMTTRQVRNFAESLKRRTDLPIYWINEALSSNSAEQRLYEQGLGYARVKEIVDQHAAAVILEAFLDQPEEKRERA